MTKEELEKEAEELYEDWYAHKLGAISIIGVICKMAEPRENRIVELEKENAELKKTVLEIGQHLDMTEREWGKDLTKMYHYKTQSTKAKEIIRDFISVAIDYIDKEDKNYSYIVEAEQFLKETEE